MFIGKYDKSVIVTYIGTLSAMIGICFIMCSSKPNLTGAIICLMISGICDMFDGKVARMCKNRTEQDKQYGIQIDSLADMVAFIVYPIIILFGLYKSFDIALCSYIVVPVITIFTVCGISRLAYFNINTASEKSIDYYSGLPVTSTAIIFPVIYLLRYVLDTRLFVSIYLATFVVISFLMIYNFKVKKFKTNTWYALCTILALIMAIVLIMLRTMF